MSTSIVSAGEPGAPRCSESATGSNTATYAVAEVLNSLETASETPEQRSKLVLECADEIQAWAKLIAQWVEREALDLEALWLRGAAIRLDALAGAVMTACQPSEPLDEAEDFFRGPSYLRAEVKS